MPVGFMQYVGHGSVESWSRVGRTGFVTPSIDVPLTLDVGIRQSAAVVLALVMLSLFRFRAVRWQFVKLMAAIGALNALIGLSMFAAGEPMIGTYANKNHFAGLLCMTLPLAVAAALRRQRQCRVRDCSPGGDMRFLAYASAALLHGLALLLSASRGGIAAALLGLAISLMVFAGPSINRVKLASWIGLATSVLAGGLVLLVGEDTIWRDYMRSASERPMQWFDTLRAVPEYWLLGSGAGTYDFVYPAYKSPELGFVRYDHAHNDYLELLITMGLVGLVLFASAVIAAASGVLRRELLRRGLANNALVFGAGWSVTGALIHAAVDFNLQIPANFLIFLLVLILLAASGPQSTATKLAHSSVGRS